jgi:hypothetical protein
VICLPSWFLMEDKCLIDLSPHVHGTTFDGDQRIVSHELNFLSLNSILISLRLTKGGGVVYVGTIGLSLGPIHPVLKGTVITHLDLTELYSYALAAERRAKSMDHFTSSSS